MAHNNSECGIRALFAIDASTRTLKNLSGGPVLLVQGDHNSTRLGFELPRYVDGHDMSLCTRVAISYTNKGSAGTSKGTYLASDLQISQENADVVTFTWLISKLATTYQGVLRFTIDFVCSQEGTLLYSLNIPEYAGLIVGKGGENSDSGEVIVYDSLQEWVDAANAGVEAAKTAAATAEAAANNAETYATEARASADQAEAAAKAAAASEGAVVESAASAARAASSADAASKSAAASAAAAATSETKAAASATAAAASEANAAASATAAAASEANAAASAEAAQVVLDSIPEDYRATVEQIATLAPAIVVAASGDVVSITDAAARPARALVSTIEPSTTGHDALHVYRTGKNLCELGTVTLTRTKTVTLGVPIPAGTYAMSAVVESTDTDSPYCNVHFVADGTALVKRLFVRSRDGERKVQTMTFERDITSMIFYASDAYASGAGDTATFADIQIEAGEAATDYEPYVGQTLIAALPETVHGGALDWMAGLLTVTHDADGAELAEPRAIQLTPQQASTLKGENHVWSDTGSTAMTYVVDTKTYIDNAIAAIAASVLNT